MRLLTVNIPEDLHRAFDAAAKARLLSKSDVVREVLLRHARKSGILPPAAAKTKPIAPGAVESAVEL